VPVQRYPRQNRRDHAIAGLKKSVFHAGSEFYGFAISSACNDLGPHKDYLFSYDSLRAGALWNTPAYGIQTRLDTRREPRNYPARSGDWIRPCGLIYKWRDLPVIVRPSRDYCAANPKVPSLI
jgi:hypothetical protein